MHKRTKIIATIGPSSKSADTIFKLYQNGMNVVRVNMSHASLDDLRDISSIVTKLNKKITPKEIAVIRKPFRSPIIVRNIFDFEIF